MNRGIRAITFLLFFIFGLLINLQFKGIILAEPKNGASAKELAAQLELEKSENAKLMEQLANLEAERDMLWRNIGDTLNNQQINELLKMKDYEYLRAGLTAVSGKGVVITMEDAPAKGELDINEYIIHDNNINDILDELKANGAQAISVNGERVMLNTRPVCAGPTIIVNESRYPPPYVIEAIGDPDILYDAIENMPQVAFMRLTNIRIDVEKQEEIVINRFRMYSTLENLLKGLEVVK
ncbi:MAG TPA: DUF881 domain-containing protein [Clostridiaceae bacterium]|jgi:uncharacterized protein YlxW (UPF0749 family)|nr:DUF881 domain-containing protein [Clostridiaceae bacterium]